MYHERFLLFRVKNKGMLLTAKAFPTPRDRDTMLIAGSHVRCYRCTEACAVASLVAQAGLVLASLEVGLGVHSGMAHGEVRIPLDFITA